MRDLKYIFLVFLFAVSLSAKDKYLVITNEAYYNSDVLKNFVDYRSNEFNMMTALNSEIGEDVEQYIEFIIQKEPNYILLVGKYTDFPSKTIPYSKSVESFNFWVAEKIDSLYNIKIPLGLFLVENEEELENVINKTILFEQNLDVMPKKLYTHSGSIEPLEPWPLEFNDEILNEMYESFFKDNGYVHRHETSLDATPNDAISDVQAINNGVRFMLYHGHGNIQKWSFGMGVQGIEFLKNEVFFPIIFSASCLTGTFTSKIDTMEAPCFGVNMLASRNGAVAFIGAYNESSKGQNPLLFGFSKYVNNRKYNRLGDALVAALNNIEMPITVKKYFPYLSAFDYNRARLQFHLFGDPALIINSESTDVDEDFGLSKAVIYPNPSSDYIEIDLKRCPTITKSLKSKIQIYNAFGECVLSESIPQLTSSHRMNIENFPVGVYFIIFGNYSEKFVVMR